VESKRRYKVVIVEDEPLYRDLLELALSRDPEIEIVGAFQDGERCLERVGEFDPDVALLDIELAGDLYGIQVGLAMRRLYPGIGIVLLSNHRDPSFVSALREGKFAGWSYLLKKSVDNVDALRRAIAGAAEGFVVLDPALIGNAPARPNTQLAKLTPRQRDIMSLMAQGYSNVGIAEKLLLSVKTVENHINCLYQELQLDRDSAFQPRVLAVLAYLDQLDLGARD